MGKNIRKYDEVLAIENSYKLHWIKKCNHLMSIVYGSEQTKKQMLVYLRVDCLINIYRRCVFCL